MTAIALAGLIAFACSAWASAAGGEPANAAASIRLLKLGDFQQPTFLTAPRGDRRRRFVVERAGRILVVRGGRTLAAPFLDIRGQVETGGESGMLSMAFAPDYARSRRFYVYYTDTRGDIRIEEFRRARSTADRALPSSRRLVLRQRHTRGNHKGGQLQFGPDGMLYAGFGDGGGSGDPDRNAQDLGTLLGKLIRIDPRRAGRRSYRSPRGNPFVGRRGRNEIYAYGLRNPYRFSFDRRKGHLTLGDVGEAQVDEINFVRNRRGRRRAPRGGYNFGWSFFEGRSRFRSGTAPGHVPPVIESPLGGGRCAIIGGYVVRDRSLGGLYGRYVYGDNCDPGLRRAALRPRRAVADRRLGPRLPLLASFGEDGRGRLHAMSLRGQVYRLARR